MTQNKLLTKEIIRHVLIGFGVSKTSTTDNTLFSKELLTSKQVKIKYDDEIEINHPVFSGKLSVSENSILRAVLIDLSMENQTEFCCVFRLDKLPLHGLRLCYDEEDTGIFKIYNDTSKVWTDTSIGVQASLLTGMEHLISFGLLWEPNDQIEDLYRAAIILAGI